MRDLSVLRLSAVILSLLGLWPLTAAANPGDFSAADAPAPEIVSARASIEAEDWRGARMALERLLAREPENADGRSLLGFAYRKLGRYDQAIVEYDRALALEPEHLGALEYLGEAYLQLDRPEETAALLARLEAACGDCEEAIELREAYESHAADGSTN